MYKNNSGFSANYVLSIFALSLVIN
jgi:hypothetical protein